MATKSATTRTASQWAFRGRLRRSAFGWRGSNPAIARINEALSEIRAVARHDPALAAEGAVLFLEKISPAVRDVDSSSGALGGATYWAVEALVPIVAAAPVSGAIRAKWLDRAIAKKYPEIEPDRLLTDLIASTPGDEGKWFATAKSLKRFDLAIDLAWRSPCDPKTLTRAARDHLRNEPAFSAEAALAALHWIAQGHGYEVTAFDVREAYRYAMEAAQSIGQADKVRIRMERILTGEGPTAKWMQQALGAGLIR